MARKTTESRNASKKVGERKVAKSYRLEPSKIAAARKALGAPSDTAAIEIALDMVVFRKELVDGTAAMLGAAVGDPFGE